MPTKPPSIGMSTAFEAGEIIRAEDGGAPPPEEKVEPAEKYFWDMD